MSLRSGVSIWQAADGAAIRSNALHGDVTCEVAILGAGVTGALVAHRLIDAGVDVVIVDKREVGTGSTAASTGLLQYELDTPLCELISMVGPENAVHAYRRGLAAIDQIEQITDELRDPCGFSRRDTLYFASHFWHRGALRREYECRKEHGFAVEFLDRQALRDCCSIRAAAAIRSRGDAQIDPYRFTQGLLRRAIERGARVFGRTEVTDIRNGAQEVTLQTPRGAIRARRIVLATGYDSYRYLPRKLGTLHSTYAVASEPLGSFDGWPGGALVWETARPYFYARQTDDGRVIVGGEDSAFSSDHQRDGLVERRAQRLAARFEKLFPQLAFQAACVWAGTFGESKDGLAYIGSCDGFPNAYFAIGYGGNGITFSMIAADLIRDLYLQRPNPDANVFGFDR